MRPSNPLSIILDKNRLIGPKFVDWLRNLKVILASKNILYVLEKNLPRPLLKNASQEKYVTLKKWKDDGIQARYIMWASLSIEIHWQHEKYTSARKILLHLQELFGEYSMIARYEISKRLFRAKMKEGKEVGAYMNSII